MAVMAPWTPRKGRKRLQVVALVRGVKVRGPRMTSSHGNVAAVVGAASIFVVQTAAAQPADPPAMTAPGAPATAVPRSGAGPLPGRSGLTFGVGAALGGVAHIEGSLGWRVNERFAVFGTALAGSTVSFTGDDRSYRVVGAGARAWPFQHLFVEGRIGRASLREQVYDDPPKLLRDHGMAYLVEIGVDSDIFGGIADGDLHLGYANMAGASGIFVGLGVTFY